jgi:putative SOS response-associated peptidase YedK
MCGRYTLSTTGQIVAEIFGLDEAPALAARYNIAPSQQVPAVRAERDTGARVVRMLRWGLHPYWSKSAPSAEARMINARSESLAERPAFRDLVRRRRCLLPADGFFEWRKAGRRKQPYLVRMRDGAPFAFAGLWDRWRGAGGEVVESCTILTTEPNALVAGIHDRMPVILPRGAFDPWLDPSAGDAEGLLPLLRPYPAEEMTLFPVSARVNDPANDDASLVEPRPEPPPPQGDLFS